MPDDVTTESFVFAGGDAVLAGRLHRRGPTFERRPGVVVTGSWLTVKEQMADLYATELARRGFAALTFDFSGWGSSGGDLRHAELPTRKIADISAAASHLASRSDVLPGGVAHLGICATAQYALAAIARGAPIRSFASVAGWYHDLESVAPFYGGPGGVEERLGRGAAATDRYLADGHVEIVPAYAPGDERAGMFIELDYYADPERGAVPTWPNEMAELSWSPWLTFDGLAAAGSVRVPTLLVHADGCVFPDNVRRLASTIDAPTTLAWGEGDQIDFYDRPAQVGFAMEAIEAHLESTVTGPVVGT